MNTNEQYFFVPIKTEIESVIVDVIPKVEYAIVPKAERQVNHGEIIPEQFITTPSLYLEEYVHPQELLVCRACLLSECRLYSMRGHNLEEIYRRLTNAPSVHKDNIPLLLCAKCACFLDKCQQFRQKTNIAQEMLNSLDFPVTYNQIKELNSKVSQQFPSLAVRQKTPNQYDYCMTENSGDETTTTNSSHIKDEPAIVNDEKKYGQPALPGEKKDESKCKKKTIFTDDETDDDDEPLANVSKHFKGQAKEKDLGNIPENKTNVSDNKNETKRKRQKHTRHDLKTSMPKQKFTLKEQLAAIQNRKESIKYKFFKYKCDICFLAYNHEDKYLKHMAQHSKDYSNHLCNVCSLRFKNHQTLLAHLRTHRWRYNCSHCSYSTTLRSAARRHLPRHDDKLYKCKFCKHVLRTEESYKEHVLEKHSVPGAATEDAEGTKCKNSWYNARVVCEVCGKNMTLSHLKGHMDEHEGKTFKCEACGKVFNNSLKYQNHIVAYHTGLTNDCPHCGKRYATKRSLHFHISVTHTNASHVCDICNKAFKCKWYLKMHLDLVHYKKKKKRIYKKKEPVVRERPAPDPAKPFVCEHCYKGFKNRAYLQQHLNFVHYKKPRNKYWKTKSKTKETTPKETNVQQEGRESLS